MNLLIKIGLGVMAYAAVALALARAISWRWHPSVPDGDRSRQAWLNEENV